MNRTAEDLGPLIARWLAPYVAEELRLRGSPPLPRPDYDETVCAELVHELGQSVLNRAADFFGRLEADSSVDSLTMARHMSLGTPRNISSALTTPVKRHAKRLGLGLPWDESVNPEGRTLWLDRDGIAGRMLTAINAEQRRRFVG